MSSETLPSLTAIVTSIPAPFQHRILTTVSSFSDDIDTAFANSPAVSNIDSTTAAPDHPTQHTESQPVRTLRQHLTFPSDWRAMLNLPGHSTWEEANTGMAVEVIQQEPDQNYLLFSPPRTPGTTTVGIHDSLEVAFLGAQLLVDIATSRDEAEFVGLTPAETAATIDAGDEQGTEFPTERLTLPDPNLDAPPEHPPAALEQFAET
jgi:hypothetical protein